VPVARHDWVLLQRERVWLGSVAKVVVAVKSTRANMERVGLFFCILTVFLPFLSALDSHFSPRDELRQLYPPFYTRGNHSSSELLASALGKTTTGAEEAVRWLTSGNASSPLAIGTFASFLLHALHATGEQNSDGSSARRVLRAIDLMRSGLPLEALLTSGWPVFSMLMHFRSVVDAAGLESDAICESNGAWSYPWDVLIEGLESLIAMARREGITIAVASHVQIIKMGFHLSMASSSKTLGHIVES